MEKVGIFYGHVVYILWTFRNEVSISPRLGIVCEEKSDNPAKG
jgi:hypothetical protein